MPIKKFAVFCLLSFGIFAGLAHAQTKQKIEPYATGEKLFYEAKFSKYIKGIAVADLDFEVTKAENNEDFLVKANVATKGTLFTLFTKKFIQNYQSTLDGVNYSVKRTVKRDQQGDRVRESEALFDYAAKKVIYVETDPTDAARPPRQIASPIPLATQDLVTAIYMMRRLPLAVGKVFELTISDSGLVYKTPVRVVAREQQPTILGKVWCFKIVPELFGENRLIEQKGDMTIWLTDDPRHLPVRSQINVSLGRLEIKLKKIEDKSAISAQTK